MDLLKDFHFVMIHIICKKYYGISISEKLPQLS